MFRLVPAPPEQNDVGDARLSSVPDGVQPPDFERLYEQHFAFAWRSLRLLGVGPELLEDAAQDVFAVVSRQLSEFAGLSSPRTWIFAIVRRTAANYKRRHRRKLRQLVPLGETHTETEPTQQAHAEALEVAAKIEHFCESLDAERRALFVLALIEGVPAAELARALELPVNTVYSRIRALRSGVARALGSEESDG